VLYLIYALFSGLVGTAFSVLIRLELSGPGVQFIVDYQLYNSIITAHAIIMIFFMIMPALAGTAFSGLIKLELLGRVVCGNFSYKYFTILVVFSHSIIADLLGISVLNSWFLIILLAIIPYIFNFIRVNNPFFDELGGLFIIYVYILTDSCITPEYCTNFPSGSHIDIVSIHLGTARMILSTLFNKNEGSYYDRLKNLVKQY
jgi:hypothetical protein